MYNNQIVAHGNIAIGLAAGHDNQAYNNRTIAAGQLSDGSWYAAYTGVDIVNCACYNQPPNVYFNNYAYSNLSGYQVEYASGTPPTFTPPVVRNDYVLTDCASTGGNSLCASNGSYANPITATMEANEFAIWQQKLSANGISIGPSS